MSNIKLDAPLTVPEAAPVLTKEQAVELVPVAETAVAVANPRAREFVKDLMTVEPGSPQFTQKLNDVFNLGDKEIKATSQISTRMLDRPAVQGKADSPQMKVAGTLQELRQQVTELDPERADIKGVKRLIKWIPGANKVDQYFQKYASAKDHLDAIDTALLSGQDSLRRDNADIEAYRKAMWTDMGRLAEYNVLLENLDAALVEKVDEAKTAGNQELAKALENDALFAVRQRRMDIATQITVSAQGYLALDIVRKNNLELIRGVDRARTTTMSAMETAIVVAQALGVQEQVLAQINGLNKTTGNLIENTSKRLATQGVEIQKQASSAMIDVQQLENSFKNVFQAMDDLDSFKVEANRNFAVTIDSLSKQIEQATPYLKRANEEGVAPNEQVVEGKVVPKPSAINWGSKS